MGCPLAGRGRAERGAVEEVQRGEEVAADDPEHSRESTRLQCVGAAAELDRGSIA